MRIQETKRELEPEAPAPIVMEEAMPIFEFLCEDCNVVYNFLARTGQAASRQPSCPRCGGARMRKLFSRFATLRRGKAGESGEKEQGADAAQSPEGQARMERAMMQMAGEIESLDENNPRQMAALMRKLSDAAGEPIDPVTDEMIRRLEAGEDLEKIEEKMADAIGDDASMGGGAPSYDGGLYDM